MVTPGIAPAHCLERGPGLRGRKGKQVEAHTLPGLSSLSCRSGETRATRAPRTAQPRGESFVKNPAGSPLGALGGGVQGSCQTLEKTRLQGLGTAPVPTGQDGKLTIRGALGRVLGSAHQEA